MAKIDSTPAPAEGKAKYQVKNWSSYNAGLKRRGSLTLWIDDDIAKQWRYAGPPQRGAQFEYSDDCIRLLLCLKVTFHLAFRQLAGFVESIFELSGIELVVPSPSQICRRQAGLNVPLGMSKRFENGEPIHLVLDSSGLKIYGECEWKVRKHGWSKRRTWRKIHLGVDEKTGQIVSQVLTDNKTDDASMLPEVLGLALESGVNVGKVGADGAYDTRDCWALLEALDMEAIIPPRENAAFELEKDGTLAEHARNRALETITDHDLKTWKTQSGYHRRSKSENVFFRWKTILGEKMYARLEDTQRTEAAIKACVLNRFIQIAAPLAVAVAKAA